MTSPLSLQDLERLKEAVWLTPEDERALREAAEILADQADDMVTAWRARRELRHRGGLRRHPVTPSPSIPQDPPDDLQHDLRQFGPQAGDLSRRRWRHVSQGIFAGCSVRAPARRARFAPPTVGGRASRRSAICTSQNRSPSSSQRRRPASSIASTIARSRCVRSAATSRSASCGDKIRGRQRDTAPAPAAMSGRQDPPSRDNCASGGEPRIWPCPPARCKSQPVITFPAVITAAGKAPSAAPLPAP